MMEGSSPMDTKDSVGHKAQQTFRQPAKEIKVPDQLPMWPNSMAFADVVGMILSLNEKIRGRSNSCKRELSPKVKHVVEFLKEAKGWIKDIPPETQAQRFGNKAFRTWLAKLQVKSEPFHEVLLGPELHSKGATAEVRVYFEECFGNITRIDYGTGHELNFVAWMTVLAKLGIFKENDLKSLVCDVFAGYLSLMRRLQMTYWLEPAGSKGAWGLDDYSFLPFLWGSAQMDGQDFILPDAIFNGPLLDKEAENYLYLGAVKYISQMKSGPFAEHSPLLNDISGVPSWNKVNSGLIKMYETEVLNKFPIIQHFFFGSILTTDESPKDHPARARPLGSRPKRARRPPPSF